MHVAVKYLYLQKLECFTWKSSTEIYSTVQKSWVSPRFFIFCKWNVKMVQQFIETINTNTAYKAKTEFVGF